MTAADSYGDPWARFYRENADDPPHWRAMFERIGRIIVAWGATESALAKMWWHLAFQAGSELDPTKLHQKSITDKIKGVRRHVPSNGSRLDRQLARIEDAIPRLQPDRHALVHGYLSITAKGPASLNLRDNHLTLGRDLQALQCWVEYAADVSHQIYEEAITEAFDAYGERVYRSDPQPPAVYNPTASLPGWPSE